MHRKLYELMHRKLYELMHRKLYELMHRKLTSLPIVSCTSLSIVSLRYPKYIETQSPVDRSSSIVSSLSTSLTSLYYSPCRPPYLRLSNQRNLEERYLKIRK